MNKIHACGRGRVNISRWVNANLNVNWDKSQAIKDFAAILKSKTRLLGGQCSGGSCFQPDMDMLGVQSLQTEFHKIREFVPTQLAEKVDTLLDALFVNPDKPLLRTDIDVNGVIQELLSASDGGAQDDWDAIYERLGPDIHGQISETVDMIMNSQPGYKLNDYVRLISGQLAKQGIDVRDRDVRALLYWCIKTSLN